MGVSWPLLGLQHRLASAPPHVHFMSAFPRTQSSPEIFQLGEFSGYFSPGRFFSPRPPWDWIPGCCGVPAFSPPSSVPMGRRSQGVCSSRPLREGLCRASRLHPGLEDGRPLCPGEQGSVLSSPQSSALRLVVCGPGPSACAHALCPSEPQSSCFLCGDMRPAVLWPPTVKCQLLFLFPCCCPADPRALLCQDLPSSLQEASPPRVVSPSLFLNSSLKLLGLHGEP